jgi:hypothetical protein
VRATDVHVPTNGDASKVKPLSARDVAHRESFVSYVLEDAEEWHREYLGGLYRLWRKWNIEHYDGQLVEPYIMLNEPSNPRRLGDCGGVSGFGGRSQIRIRPSLLTGTHPAMKEGARFKEGRLRYVADVLLHEMIHQWQYEIVGKDEESYHGHGSIFRDKANEIGTKLGLPPVRTKHGKDKDVPLCSYFAHAVRPAGYYLGAFKQRRRVPRGDGVQGTFVPLDIEQAAVVLRKHFDVDALCAAMRSAS